MSGMQVFVSVCFAPFYPTLLCADSRLLNSPACARACSLFRSPAVNGDADWLQSVPVHFFEYGAAKKVRPPDLFPLPSCAIVSGLRLTHSNPACLLESIMRPPPQRPDPAFGTPGKWSQHLHVHNHDLSPKSPKSARTVPRSPKSPLVCSAPSSPHVSAHVQSELKSGARNFALDGEREHPTSTLRSRNVAPPPTGLSMLKNSALVRPPTLIISHEDGSAVTSRNGDDDETKEDNASKKKA